MDKRDHDVKPGTIRWVFNQSQQKEYKCSEQETTRHENAESVLVAEFADQSKEKESANAPDNALDLKQRVHFSRISYGTSFRVVKSLKPRQNVDLKDDNWAAAQGQYQEAN